MAKVAIKALTDAGFAFTLYHLEYCEVVGTCLCKVTRSLRTQTLANGASGEQYVKSVQPKDVYLTRGQVVDLDARVLRMPQIAAAVRLGRIEVKDIPPPPAPPADRGAGTAFVEVAPKGADRSKSQK